MPHAPSAGEPPTGVDVEPCRRNNRITQPLEAEVACQKTRPLKYAPQGFMFSPIAG